MAFSWRLEFALVVSSAEVMLFGPFADIVCLGKSTVVVASEFVRPSVEVVTLSAEVDGGRLVADDACVAPLATVNSSGGVFIS